MNVLVIGLEKAGKSAMVRVLADPEYEEQRARGLSHTKREPSIVELTAPVKDEEVVLRICDTPGVSDGHIQEDLASVLEQASARFSELHMICYVANVQTIFQQAELLALRHMDHLLDGNMRPITLLVLTHCEMKNADAKQSLSTDLEEREDLQEKYDRYAA